MGYDAEGSFVTIAVKLAFACLYVCEDVCKCVTPHLCISKQIEGKM